MANDNLVGQQLSSYRLISQLGVGTFSEVYPGEHMHFGTKAAIKVLQTQSDRQDFTARGGNSHIQAKMIE
jgi:serine/threonine protein kinase